MFVVVADIGYCPLCVGCGEIAVGGMNPRVKNYLKILDTMSLEEE